MNDVASADKLFHGHPQAPCPYAQAAPFCQVGRMCQLDSMYCANWDKPELVARCPTLNDPHYNKELRT